MNTTACLQIFAHGTELTATNVQGLVADLIGSNRLPQDPGGIYVVLASADVGSSATGFCVPGARPHHGTGEALGSAFPFDRYGLENADKCEGRFGQPYLTPNGARANLRLGYRDFLIQQNWVNDGKGRCAMDQYR